MRIHCSIVGLIAALVCGLAGASETAKPLTQIIQIRGLSQTEAAKALPVHVTGVVTWVPSSGWFIVQDETAGVSVGVSRARRANFWSEADSKGPVLQVGDEVEVEGVTNGSGFAPGILPKTVKVLGKKALPPARPAVPARFFAGADACERVEIRGVVQSYDRRGPHDIVLTVDANPGLFTVETKSSVLSDPAPLVDAEVRLTGAAGTFFNSRGEITGARLLLGRAEDLVIEKLPNSTPFAGPVVELNRLRSFQPDITWPHRQLVEGTVIYSEAGSIFYIQQKDTAVRVEALSTADIQPGDRVLVAGFVNMRRRFAGLSGALVRKIGQDVIPPPARIEPAEILSRNSQALLRGEIPSPTDYDGRLITFEGALIKLDSATGNVPPYYCLTINAKGNIVDVFLNNRHPGAFGSLRPGSVLKVTGIAQVGGAEAAPFGLASQRPPNGLHVLLQAPSGVSVVSAPPWWTPQRLLGALALIGAVLAGVVFWSWQLRRQLARKSKQLTVEMRARRDAAIEFEAALQERNRLAANLHDSLLQTVTGLAYQLEACDASDGASPGRASHLDTARRMVQRAHDDLRGTVWALRVLPLQEERTLADALRTVASQLVENREVEMVVRAESGLPELSPFVAGNLLLVAQEAIHNALKHASPSRIEATISVLAISNRIVLKIHDNGVGFDLKTSPHELSAHFGLSGMRERIQRLDGSLTIESRPGKGTLVRAEIPLRTFDDDIAATDHHLTHSDPADR